MLSKGPKRETGTRVLKSKILRKAAPIRPAKKQETNKLALTNKSGAENLKYCGDDAGVLEWDDARADAGAEGVGDVVGAGAERQKEGDQEAGDQNPGHVLTPRSGRRAGRWKGRRRSRRLGAANITAAGRQQQYHKKHPPAVGACHCRASKSPHSVSQSEERSWKSGGGRALVLHFYMRPRVLLSEMLIFGADGHLRAGARIFIADYRHDANRHRTNGRLTRSCTVFICKWMPLFVCWGPRPATSAAADKRCCCCGTALCSLLKMQNDARQ